MTTGIKTDVGARVFSRAGTLTVFVNRESNSVSIMDDYDISGLDSLGASLQFSATLNQLETAWSAQVKIYQSTRLRKINF